MKLAIVGNYPALARFYDLGVAEATAVDRAVIRFAETGRGNIARDGPYGILLVGAFRVRFTVIRESRTLNVLYIYYAR
jgi:hypothetical protein